MRATIRQVEKVKANPEQVQVAQFKLSEIKVLLQALLHLTSIVANSEGYCYQAKKGVCMLEMWKGKRPPQRLYYGHWCGKQVKTSTAKDNRSC